MEKSNREKVKCKSRYSFVCSDMHYSFLFTLIENGIFTGYFDQDVNVSDGDTHLYHVQNYKKKIAKI